MDYNERLFNKNTLRGKLHFARFHWLERNVKKYTPNANSVLELGCYDAKTLEFLPISMSSYHGYDANWEKGLDIARNKYSSLKNVQFFETTKTDEFNPSNSMFDISISMETLEHIPAALVEIYVQKLSAMTVDYCFITVPNEKGFVFFLKYLSKLFFFPKGREKYSFREFINASLGKLDRVPRSEHKGFDYEKLQRMLENYFIIEKIEGIPSNFFGHRMAFTVGFVLKKKTQDLI